MTHKFDFIMIAITRKYCGEIIIHKTQHNNIAIVEKIK